jgi:hypothetical protein
MISSQIQTLEYNEAGFLCVTQLMVEVLELLRTALNQEDGLICAGSKAYK